MGATQFAPSATPICPGGAPVPHARARIQAPTRRARAHPRTARHLRSLTRSGVFFHQRHSRSGWLAGAQGAAGDANGDGAGGGAVAGAAAPGGRRGPPLSGFVTPARRAKDQSRPDQAPGVLYRQEGEGDRRAGVVDRREVLDLGLGPLRVGSQEMRAKEWNNECFWFSPVVYKAPCNFEL
jgi:hypothetical protein